MAAHSARSLGSEVDSEKLRLKFVQPCDRGMETEFIRASIWKTAKSHRLDFVETNPRVRFQRQDLISNRRDFDSVMKTSYKKERTHLFADQKASLEAMFSKNQFPSGDELAAKAAQLNIDLSRVQKWFCNRRHKWRKEQRKDGLVASGLCHAIFPRCCFGCFAQSLDPVGCDGEPLPVMRALFVTELPSAHQFTQSLTESFNTQQTPHQDPPLPRPLFVEETRSSRLYQQGYLPLPNPGHNLSEQQLQTENFVQQAAIPSNPAHSSSEQDVRRRIDQFPFVYSFAENLPNIFGNQENDD